MTQLIQEAESQPGPGVFVFKAESLLPGQLGGSVVDPSGAAIGNARITVTTSDTGYKANTATNSDGSWRVFGISSGRVRIQVDSQGFRTITQDVIYDANRPGPVNLVLQVGSISEAIEVTSVAVNGRYDEVEHQAKKQAQAAQVAPSSNVVNLQRRVAGVLPVAIEVPHAGTAFHFVRPLVGNEETKVTFAYKSK